MYVKLYMSGLSSEEVEKWIQLDSNNSITSFSDYLYRLGAFIPEDIKKLVMSKERENAVFLGSTLRITKSNNEEFYSLGIYTVTQGDNTFLITRSNYTLVNFSVNYQPFLNSSDYIFLNLKPENVSFDSTFFAQGTKYDNNYGVIFLNNYSGEILEARNISFSGDKAYLFNVLRLGGKNFPNPIPVDVYTTFSVTPSILKLAKSIYSLSPQVQNAKTISKTKNKKYNKLSHYSN